MVKNIGQPIKSKQMKNIRQLYSWRVKSNLQYKHEMKRNDDGQV